MTKSLKSGSYKPLLKDCVRFGVSIGDKGLRRKSWDAELSSGTC